MKRISLNRLLRSAAAFIPLPATMPPTKTTTESESSSGILKPASMTTRGETAQSSPP